MNEWPGVWPSSSGLHLSNTLLLLLLSCFSQVQLFATLWTIVRQTPLSTGFSKQEYWSRLPCPPPGDLPDPGIKLVSLKSPALAGGFFTTSTTWEAQYSIYKHYFSAKLFESKLQTSHRFTSKTLNKYRPLTRGFSHTRTQSGLPAREICTGFRRGKWRNPDWRVLTLLPLLDKVQFHKKSLI